MIVGKSYVISFMAWCLIETKETKCFFSFQQEYLFLCCVNTYILHKMVKLGCLKKLDCHTPRKLLYKPSKSTNASTKISTCTHGGSWVLITTISKFKSSAFLYNSSKYLYSNKCQEISMGQTTFTILCSCI